MRKTLCFWLILNLYASVLGSESCCSKYKHISDCRYDSVVGNDNGADYLTFICAENPKELLPREGYFDCSHRDTINYNYTGTIMFKNCRFETIEGSLFKKFTHLHTIKMTDLGLEKLTMKSLPESITKLTNVDASQNRITEIPPMIFSNSPNLKHVNLSNNFIKDVSSSGFAGAFDLETLDLSRNNIFEFKAQLIRNQKKLKVLNLSHNQINSLDIRNVSTRNLTTLDVSFNALTTLIDHTFDKLTELEILNLSYNLIGNFKKGTFAYASKLQHLNLRKTGVISIQLGTFSHQHRLISLDLSDNRLTGIDFSLFLPRLDNLHSLNLSGNQLTELTDFHNSLFPQLNEFDIKNNRFNCSYLKHLMKSADWKGISLVVDPKTMNPDEDNIRGIRCVHSNVNQTTDGRVVIQKSNAVIYIKYCLIVICIIVIAVILVIFLWSIRGRIKLNRRSVTVHEIGSVSFQCREYTNDDDLLK